MLGEAAGAVTESAAEAALQECSEDADALSAQGSLKSFFSHIQDRYRRVSGSSPGFYGKRCGRL